MDMQISSTMVKETTFGYKNGNVIVYPWASCEGVTVILESKSGKVAFTASLQWEDLNALIAALSASQV